MKDFIEYLVKQIVTNPEDADVYHVKTEYGDEYHITVSKDDMGLIIGKDGRTIKSIRSIAKAKAIKEDVRVRIEIDEPEDSDFVREQDEEPESEELDETLDDEEDDQD